MEKIGKDKLALLIKKTAWECSPIDRREDARRPQASRKTQESKEAFLLREDRAAYGEKAKETKAEIAEQRISRGARESGYHRPVHGRHQALHPHRDRPRDQFAFAYAYTSHASEAAADFMALFKSSRSRIPSPMCRRTTDRNSRTISRSTCEHEGIVHFHTYPRYPKMNAEIERFNRTLSEAFIAKNRDLLAYNTLPSTGVDGLAPLVQHPKATLVDWPSLSNAVYCEEPNAEESHMLWTSTGI